MRVLYVLLALALWAPGQVMSQVKIQKKPQKQPKQIQKEAHKTAASDSLVPANMILPDSLNKEYQQKFRDLQEVLQINFKRNRSGKLQFCSTPYLMHPAWLDSNYRFANTMVDLDHFESLLCQLNVFYLQPDISEREQYQILAITRELRRLNNKSIIVVTRHRKKIDTRHFSTSSVLYSLAKISVEFVPVLVNKNIQMEGTRVYAIRPAHFYDCETCTDCLATDSRCDLNTLLEESTSGVYKMEPGVKIDPGPYYIFVTENDFEVERVVYYELRTLGSGDAGKVIRLYVK